MNFNKFFSAKGPLRHSFSEASGPASGGQSKTFRRVLWGIGIAIILLAAFKAGEFVGFRKASFSYRWGENYYRSFTGPRGGFFGELGGRDFMMGHGTSGTIVKVATSTLVVQDRDNAEKVILITKNTVVNRFRDTIPASDLKENDNVVIIGSPNDAGQIEAKLIRVLPPPGVPGAFPGPASGTPLKTPQQR